MINIILSGLYRFSGKHIADLAMLWSHFYPYSGMFLTQFPGLSEHPAHVFFHFEILRHRGSEFLRISHAFQCPDQLFS